MTNPIFATAWLSSGLFFCARLRLPETVANWPRIAGWLDRFGAASLCIHILFSYWLAHHWSHAEAVEHVADRTQRAIGLRSGLGIYANFVTATLWIFVAYRRRPSQASPPTSPTQFYHSSKFLVLGELYLWAMFIQASIIFARPWTAMAFSIVAVLVLLSIYCFPAEPSR